MLKINVYSNNVTRVSQKKRNWLIYVPIKTKSAAWMESGDSSKQALDMYSSGNNNFY